MERFKYYRTPHLPGSKGKTADDVDTTFEPFIGKQVVISEKMDGENTSLYSDGYTHARSIDSKYHASRTWIKSDWGGKAWILAEEPDMRICGEAMYAKHSIAYDALDSYFYVFAVMRGTQVMSWETTKIVAAGLDYPTVPVLYEGEFSVAVFDKIVAGLDTTKQEGVVVRLAGGYDMADAPTNIGKWVRSNHVQTGERWEKTWIPNKLA